MCGCKINHLIMQERTVMCIFCDTYIYLLIYILIRYKIHICINVFLQSTQQNTVFPTH